MTPEEKLLRAIFGEKASDVRDTSLRVPPGVQGTIVEVRVFNRHGVDKDERALAIEREEIERLAKDRDDEQAILDRNVYGRLAELLENRQGIAGPKGFKKDTKITRAVLDEHPRSQWWMFASPNDKLMAEIEAMRKQYDESKKGWSSWATTCGTACRSRRRCSTVPRKATSSTCSISPGSIIRAR